MCRIGAVAHLFVGFLLYLDRLIVEFRLSFLGWNNFCHYFVVHFIMGTFTKPQAQGVNLSHTIKIANLNTVAPAAAHKRVLLRVVIGEVLRARRQLAGRTLREISKDAQVSLGYLSEIERGQKEASSELLASICAALDLSLSALLFDASLEISRSDLNASATNLN